MKHKDELDLWDLVKDDTSGEPIGWSALFKKLNIPQGRGEYIVEKWCNKGIVNYGCSVRWAWFEDKTKWSTA